MDAEHFAAWRAQMKYNRAEAAKILGLSRNMPQKYEEGGVSIPLYIELACAAIASGLSRWTPVPQASGKVVLHSAVVDRSHELAGPHGEELIAGYNAALEAIVQEQKRFSHHGFDEKQGYWWARNDAVAGEGFRLHIWWILGAA